MIGESVGVWPAAARPKMAAAPNPRRVSNGCPTFKILSDCAGQVKIEFRTMQVEPVVLMGKYVRLEPLSLAHHPALCEIGLDPELWRWTIAQVLTPDQMRGYMEIALQWQADGTAIPFATVDLASGRVVGSTRFMTIDRPNRHVEIGSTWIAAPWQRTAVNTEAKYLMLRHAFEQWGCIRVELKTDS